MTGTPPKPPLGRHILELLQESPHGITPPAILDLALEFQWVEKTRGRGPYQRILRALAQLEAEGLIRKAGRRFVLNAAALEAAAHKEVEDSLAQALAGAKLPASPAPWIEHLKRMVGK